MQWDACRYSVGEIALEVISAVIWALCIGLAPGLVTRWPDVLKLAFGGFAMINVGESIGIVFFAVLEHVGLGVHFLSLVLGIFSVMGGILALNIPAGLGAINQISVVKYYTKLAAPLALTDATLFHCTPAQLGPHGECPYATGTQVLAQLGLHGARVTDAIVALSVVVVAYRALSLAALVLRARVT